MIIERIKQIIDYKNISTRQFCMRVGIANGFLDKVKDVGSEKLLKILKEFPEIDAEWLLTGKGEMIKSSTQNISIEGQNKNLNNINGGNNINISQNDISEIIEIQREMNNIIKTSQSQLTKSQNQIDTLLEILKSK